jgi:hypothetical protein
LLPLQRQTLELRIALQRASLLINGLVSVLIQPLAKMMALGWRLISAARNRC